MMPTMTEDTSAPVMHAPGGLAHVQVATTGVGTASVVVNGTDVSRQVGGVTIAARPMTIPRVVIELLGEASFDGDGILEYAVPAPVDEQAVKERVRDWLNGLDWTLLQAAAAEGAMAAPIGEAFRAALLDELDRDW